ncbi:MAG: HAMP domain-containing protein [Clostridia bacterium]|nr:HAMP domain-containing protein [Clostridia bacterium]
MRGGLFWRIFSAIMAAMLITVILFTGIMSTSLQQVRQGSYENEVRLQAREIAEYMINLNQINSVRENVTMQFIVRRKISEIHDLYNADIWIVNFNSEIAQVLDSSWNTASQIYSPTVTRQLQVIQGGQEIRVTGLFPELGEQIVTIGVPWFYSDGRVVGAVLLHISTEQLEVSILDLLPQILPTATLTLLLGTLISLLLAQGQTRPLKEIDNAVREFTKGDLTRRVELHCGGELEDLGNSINRMASELSQLEDSRRNFVAAVSHELRSPLTCMRGYVDAMMDGTIEGEDVPKYLQIVKDETNRLTDLVRDLLDMSRFESGKFPLQIAPFDANEMLRRILINFEPRIDQKKIEVQVEFDAEHRYVSGDASRINQVLSNFIDNALKFMSEGGTLTVGTRLEGRNVLFTVRNDGEPIAEKDLPHIFERFYKADKAHTSGMGTGLGLAICKMIVQEHGSRIRVRSVPGDTAFEFTLPTANPPEIRTSIE